MTSTRSRRKKVEVIGVRSVCMCVGRWGREKGGVVVIRIAIYIEDDAPSLLSKQKAENKQKGDVCVCVRACVNNVLSLKRRRTVSLTVLP